MSFSLRQIASWASGDSEVILPALQRGLVWKPNQVELLWDSILRGFPIGSFMLSEIVEVGQKGKYYLMDGQQRYNAISLGYNTVPKAKAVLWMDLEPPTVKNSTRHFWIKATTQPHPWGFKNDDDCSRLNTTEKRQALNQFNLQGSIYNNLRFQKKLEKNNIIQSMSRKGTPLDNSPMESFFSTLKSEVIYNPLIKINNYEDLKK